MNKDIVKCNTTIYWCFHNKVADLSQKYEVTLGNLSDEAKTGLEAIGLEVRTREDKPEYGNYISVRSQYPLNIYDADGGEVQSLIGNGSKGVATIGTYEWNFKKKPGISPTLIRLGLTELVEFVPANDNLPVL